MKNKISNILLLSMSFALILSWHTANGIKGDGILKAWNEKTHQLIDSKMGRVKFFQFDPGKMTIHISTKDIFNKTKSKDFYEVISKPSLRQEAGGPCGYYALYNIYCLIKKDQKEEDNFFLNRSKFDRIHKRWSEYIREIRNKDKLDWLDNLEILQLIQNSKEPVLKGRTNFYIINSTPQMHGYGQKLKKRKKTIYGQLVPNQVIKNFREKKRPFYLIAYTGMPGETTPEEDIEFVKPLNRVDVTTIKLPWEKTRLRQISSMHWIAMKFEWTGIAGKSPVKIIVLDSLGGRDNRFTSLIHYYYWLLVHKPI